MYASCQNEISATGYQDVYCIFSTKDRSTYVKILPKVQLLGKRHTNVYLLHLFYTHVCDFN